MAVEHSDRIAVLVVEPHNVEHTVADLSCAALAALWAIASTHNDL